MADSQAIFVGGGLAANPAFNATDESLGRGVIVTSDDPAAVGAAITYGQRSGFFWAQSGLTSAQSVTNLQNAVLIGVSLANLATAVTGTISPVIIGRGAGINVTGGTVIGTGVAIGDGAITDAAAVCIGAGVAVNCNSGNDNPTLINCTAVTGTAVTSGIFIGMGGGGSPTINANGGIYLQGHTNGAAVSDGIAIFGTVEGSNSMSVGRLARANGASCVALGSGAQAPPTAGTQYDQCIAIGLSAVATGTGATGIRNSIAIGASATATSSAAGSAAVAIGPAASAAAGQAVLGSTTFPLELRVIAAAAGERLRVDATAVAGNTALLLYDVDNNTLERVTVGAADSGGVGFKVLRIPN